MEKNKNKIEWQFDRLEGEDSIWRGTTPKGAVFYGVRNDDNIIDIGERRYKYIFYGDNLQLTRFQIDKKGIINGYISLDKITAKD